MNPHDAASVSGVSPPPKLDIQHPLEELRVLVAGAFDVEDITAGAGDSTALRLRGRLKVEPETLHARLRRHYGPRGRAVLLRREAERDIVLIVPGVRPTPNNRWLPLLLAALTVLSVLFTHAFYWEATELSWLGILRHLHRGWAFAASLLGILLAHELGHYFTARRNGVAVTLPYLIPFPLSPFGTMGAVIRMKDVPPNRRVMLRIGAAGPLAGLVVAIPVLLLGLHLSELAPLPEGVPYWVEGNSLLYLGLKALVFGRLLPAAGVDVHLHPVAFAGWAGLLVTAFNLIPAGQLDGGHVAQALLGAKARRLTLVVIAVLFVLGFWWPGWLIWAALVFVFSRATVQPLDTITPIDRREMVLGIVMLLIFVLTFTPLPLRLAM